VFPIIVHHNYNEFYVYGEDNAQDFVEVREKQTGRARAKTGVRPFTDL
jgi:hypothetical protein